MAGCGGDWKQPWTITTVAGSMKTNIDTLRSVVRHPAVRNYGQDFLPISTEFLQAEAKQLEEIATRLPTQASTRSISKIAEVEEWPQAPPGVETITSPVAGSVSAVRVNAGDTVTEGQGPMRGNIHEDGHLDTSETVRCC